MTVKFAVSVPEDLFQRAEAERVAASLTRSAMVQRALADWIRKQVTARLDEQYIEGYRRLPEDPLEHEAMTQLGLSAWSDERWTEADVVWPEERDTQAVRVAEEPSRAYSAGEDTDRPDLKE